MTLAFRAAAGSQGGSATSLTVATTLPTGWATNDLCFALVNVGNANVWTNLNGWLLLSTDANSGGTAFTSGLYVRRLRAGDGAPTFTSTGTAGKYAWTTISFYEDAGGLVDLDTSGLGKLSTTVAATTATAPARTAVAGSVCSLILEAAREQVTQATADACTPPTNWTEPTNGDQSTAVGATTATRQVAAEVCYRLAQSGTITPGVSTWLSSTMVQYHLLLTSAAASSAPLPGRLARRALWQPGRADRRHVYT